MEPIKLKDVSPSELKEHYEWYVDSLEDTGEIPLSYDEYVRDKGQDTVIADTRFPNEVKQIRRHGGKIILVKRGFDPDWFVNYVEGNIEPQGIHSSEYAWAREEFDFVIDNDGTKEELYAKIDDLIVSNKITNPPSKSTSAGQPLAIGANSF